ncbi:hypothetical protein N9351_04265 [Candidatus Thioglobus sp.]|nr:hypothetical protein [Candidatus Thioglobus sp.]
MNRFMVLLLSLMMTSVFAHANSEHSLGTQADSMKSSGKTYHQSSSMIRKMHPEFMNHKRDKTLRRKYPIKCRKNGSFIGFFGFGAVFFLKFSK